MKLRLILAALIALSLALAPATGEATISTNPVDMTMAANADMPCCPCCGDHDNFKNSVGCALKCINFVGALFPAAIVTRLCLVEAAPPSFVNERLSGRATRPPTHPPQA